MLTSIMVVKGYWINCMLYVIHFTNSLFVTQPTNLKFVLLTWYQFWPGCQGKTLRTADNSPSSLQGRQPSGWGQTGFYAALIAPSFAAGGIGAGCECPWEKNIKGYDLDGKVHFCHCTKGACVCVSLVRLKSFLLMIAQIDNMWWMYTLSLVMDILSAARGSNYKWEWVTGCVWHACIIKKHYEDHRRWQQLVEFQWLRVPVYNHKSNRDWTGRYFPIL